MQMRVQKGNALLGKKNLHLCQKKDPASYRVN